MLIFLGAWAAVSTVCAVYFGNKAKVLGNTVSYLIMFISDKTDYELEEVIATLAEYTKEN